MMILGICDNVDILKVIRIIRIVITIIKIVVPIILILSCMTEALRAVTSNDTDITSKMLKNWATKAIAAILIFLIPTFVNILANISSTSTSEFSKCINDSTLERIDELSVDSARKYIKIARDTLSNSDYSVARRMVNKISDKDSRKVLLDELSIIADYIDIRKQISELTRKYDADKYKKLKERIEAITEEDIKERLLEEFKKIKPKDVGWWWPIGSKETTTVGGATFAEGYPAATTITATFAGNDSVHQGYHGAIDIGAYRENVIASKSGTVIYPKKSDRIDYPDQAIKSIAEDCPGLQANYVIIDHGDGFITKYSHLYKNTITVRAGDHVEQGQVIGISGSSGCSTGPHLHFQMELNGSRVDPLNYVSVSEPRP